MDDRKGPAARRARAVLDVVVFGVFAALFLTREGPSYTVHSLIGLAALAPLAGHLWPNRRWIAAAWGREGWGRKVRLSRLNMVLAVSFVVCTVTGIFSWVGVTAFDVPHAFTGFISLGAAVVHGVRNRQRFMSLVRSKAFPMGGH